MNNCIQKETGILSHVDLKTHKGKTIYIAFILILLIVSLVSLVPAIWTILTAFKDSKEIYSSFSFFPKDMTFKKAVDSVRNALDLLHIGPAVINTVVLSLGQLFFSIIVCGFGGYSLSKLKPTGTKLIFALVVWTMMIPSQIALVPNYISWLHFPFAFDFGIGANLLDTYWPMWLMAGADTFSVLLFKNAFDGLPNSYVGAAKVDGCNNFQIFFKIMLPLVAPVIIYQSVMVLSAAWSNFMIPLLVLDQKEIIPLMVYRLKSNASIPMNVYFMLLVLSSIPPFIIYLAFQKRILGGLTVGGVKG